MTFAQIIFLLGAAGVAGPILAHLLARPRYRRIPFTMLRFLQVGRRDIQSKRRIRNLLLLLLRCLIIVVLAILFAGPMLIRDVPPEIPKHVYYLGIDNSISMSYRDMSGTYIDKALAAARDIIRGAPEDSVFNICTLAGGGWARDLNSRGALASLARTKLVPQGVALEEFLSEIKSAKRRGNKGKRICAAILSDFTPQVLAQLAAVSEPAPVNDARHVNVASTGTIDNVAISGVQATDAPQGGITFNVTIANYGSAPAETRVSAVIRDKIAASVQTAVSGGEKRVLGLEVPLDTARTAGSCVPIEFTIERADRLAADNKYYYALILPKQGETSVVLCGSDSRELFLLKTALEALSAVGSFEKIRIREVLYGAFEPGALKTSNVAIFAGIPHILAQTSEQVEAFVRAGGRAVFFVSRETNPAAAEQLFAKGVLPALPRQLKQEPTALEAAGPAPDTIPGIGAEEISAVQTYAPDRILMTGSYECEGAPEAVVSWFLKNSNGFLYVRPVGNGVSLLVNTSADDSLGTLTKSPASIAFCRLLLGSAAKPLSNNFACTQAVTLQAVAAEERTAAAGKPVWVMTPSGESAEAALVKSFLVVRCPEQTGFVSTLAKPERYAGVNLPEGETDMTAPAPENVAMLTARAIRAEAKEDDTATVAESRKDTLPIWRYFAWAALALVLLEAFVANRSQR